MCTYHVAVNGQDETTQKFYTAGSSQVAVRTKTDGQDTLTWVLSNHLGSASVTANADGTLKSEIRYTAFGEVRSSSGVTDTPYQYNGQLSQMEQIGLYYYGARWYDPDLGRWAQPDPIVPLERQGVQAWDRYAYVNNSPVKFYDQNGHDTGCGDDCYDYYTTVMRDLYNQSKSDADFLVSLYRSGKLGSTAQETTEAIKIATYSAPYQHFNGEYGDSGFKPELQDGMDQIGHFVTAVRLGESTELFYGQSLVNSLVIGHELVGDDQLTFQGKLPKANHALQLLAGVTNPLANLLYLLDTPQADQVLLGLDLNPDGSSPNRFGNSLADLRLSRLGTSFGLQVETGAITSNSEAAAWLQNNLITSNTEAAPWLQNNVCGGHTGCY